MTMGAKVGSIDQVKDFRIAVVKFQESGNLALSDGDSDINRTQAWLETEQLSFWNSQIHKRREALFKAEEALRFKRIYKDPTGRTPSAVEEMKAVELAKKRVAEAEQKLGNTKNWIRRLQKESMLYRGGVGRFTNDVSSLLPQAVAHLSNTIQMLEQYVGIAPGAASGGGESVSGQLGAADSTGASMARNIEEIPAAEEETLDPAALRASIPDARTLAKSPAAVSGLLTLSCPLISENHRQILGAFAGDAPLTPEEERIYLSTVADLAEGIFFLREPETGVLVISPLEGAGAQPYNTVSAGDLLTGRPDLAEILRLPPGTLAVVSPHAVTVFHKENGEIMKL